MGNLFRLCYLVAVFCLIFVTVRLPGLGISVGDAFVAAAVGVWAIAYVLHRGGADWGIPSHPLWLPAMLILFGGLLSSLFAVNLTTSIAITVKIAFVVSVWVAMGIVMVRRGDLRLVLWTFVAAAFLTSFVAVEDRITGLDLGGKIAGRTEIFWNRSTGTVGHPVELAFITSTALPIVLGLLIEEWQAQRRWWLLSICAIGLATILVAIFLAGSVAGWITSALTTGLICLLLLARADNRVRLGLIALIFVCAIGVGVYLSEPSRLQYVNFLIDFNLGRAATITGPDRFHLLNEALDVVSRNPLIGAGMDQTGTGGLDHAQLVTSDVVHNVFVGGWLGGGLFVELGILACYLIGFLTALNALWRGFRASDWLIVALGACVLGWIVFDQTQPHLYHRHTWLILALLFGLGYQIRWRRPAPARGDVVRARAIGNFAQGT